MKLSPFEIFQSKAYTEDEVWQLEFESRTDEDLQNIMDYNIKEENYEMCALIRDELNRRKP